MTDGRGGYASIVNVAEDAEAKTVLVHVCNQPTDNVTWVVEQLRSRYAWDGDVKIDFTDDGEEIWTLRGVEGLDGGASVRAGTPVVLGDRLVPEVR